MLIWADNLHLIYNYSNKWTGLHTFENSVHYFYLGQFFKAKPIDKQLIITTAQLHHLNKASELYRIMSAIGNKASVLDVKVSCFSSYRGKKPKPVNLLTWLQSNKYAGKIQELRKLENKKARDEIKASLPAVTVSGLFYPYRKAEYLIQHSGLICIDIDYKDNQHISNYDQLKEQLFNIEHVAYAGLSASGRGFFLIIPIQYPEWHSLHFNALENDFNQLGIVIDKAPKSVVSLRGYSSDTSKLFRKKVTTYSSILYNADEKKKCSGYSYNKGVSRGQSHTQYPHTNIVTTQQRVEKTINIIIQNRLDVTIHEPEWFLLACAIANEFGEYGRGYFHAISQFHPKYRFSEANRKYSHALKKRYSKIGIGTFFKIVRPYLQFL